MEVSAKAINLYDVWNFSFLFLSVCINTVTYLLSVASYFCRHIYLLKLSECLTKPQRMEHSTHFYRISICFACRKIENQQMSQKYPANVCSLSSSWTAVPPCCVYSLYYTSICCQRQVCKIGRMWESICRARPWSLGILRASLAHPVSIPALCPARAGCQALLPWSPGLSAVTMPCDRGQGMRSEGAPPLIPAGLALPSARRLPPAFCRRLGFVVLPSPGPAFVVLLPGRGKVLESRKDDLKAGSQPSFLIVCKTPSAARRHLTKPSGEGGAGTP